MGDPFKVRSAETSSPTEIGVEFVADNTEYAKIAAHEHTLAWGSRGSGKTMHVRFLEPAAVIARHQFNDPYGGFRGLLDSGNGFVGIYINCRDSSLSRQEFRVADRPENREMFLAFSERYLAQAVLRQLALVFTEQLPCFRHLSLSAVALPRSLTRSHEGPTFELGEFCDELLISTAENLEVGRRLFDNSLLGLSPPPEERRAFLQLPTLDPDLTSLLQTIQTAIGTNAPFFLIFDDANELSETFQQLVSGLLGRRSQRYLCVKVASQRHGFRTDRGAGLPAQETHDFVSVDLDALYTNNQDAYYKRVLGIANQRLRRAGFKLEASEFLPPNPTDTEMIRKAREMAGQRFDELPEGSRPKDRANFVKKYAPAIVYQELKPAKAGKSYAGFDNLVHLSSGIVRSFLDCCSRMYLKEIESHPSPEPAFIPVGVQNEIIDEYSDQFLDSLQSRIDSLQENAEERLAYLDLQNLIRALGKLFRVRLMDRTSREPRVISVSLKDKASPRVERALLRAEQEAYLHRVWYRSKRGTGKLPCYVLNRRLGPHFGLDISGFQGRIEVDSSLLEVALESPEEFVLKVLPSANARSGENESPPQAELWEW